MNPFEADDNLSSSMNPSQQTVTDSNSVAENQQKGSDVNSSVKLANNNGGNDSMGLEVEKTDWDAVAKSLLVDNFILTALELHTEFMESGHGELRRLREFFSNPANFELATHLETPGIGSLRRTSSVHTIDSLGSHPSSMVDDGGAGEVAVMEFELRKARETIGKLRQQLTDASRQLETSASLSNPYQQQQQQQPIVTDEGDSPGRRTSTHHKSPNHNDRNSTAGAIDSSPLLRHEQLTLNFLVSEYLLQNEYKLTAVTFSDEVPDQDFEDWDEVGLNRARPQSLLALYRQSEQQHQSQARGGQKNEMCDAETNTDENSSSLLLTSSTETGNDGQSSLNDPSLESMVAAEEQIRLLEEEIKVLKAQLDNQTDDQKFHETRQGVLLINNDNNSNISDITSGSQQQQQQQQLHQVQTSSNNTPNNINIVNVISNPSTRKIPPKLLKHVTHELDVLNPKNNGMDDLDVGHGSSDGGGMTTLDMINKINLSPHKAKDEVINDSFPGLLPHILLNKRELAIPLLLTAAIEHPGLLTHVFNIVKKPEAYQRASITSACLKYSLAVGPDRTQTELLPLCWEQSDMLSSLVLSMLQQMLMEEKDTEVKPHILRALTHLTLHISDTDKYNQIWDLVQRSVMEGEDSARRLLLPTFAIWSEEIGKLHSGLISHFIRKLSQIVTSRGISQSGNESVIVCYIACLEALIPRLFHSLLSTIPFATTPTPSSSSSTSLISSSKEGRFPKLPGVPSPELMFDEGGGEGDECSFWSLVHAYDEATGKEWFTTWDSMEFLLNKMIPELVGISLRMEVSLGRALPAFIGYWQTLKHYLGGPLIRHKVKPLFIHALENPKSLQSGVLPILAVAIFTPNSETDEESELKRLLTRKFLIAAADDMSSLGMSITFFELSSYYRNEMGSLLSVIWEFISHKDPKARCLMAQLMSRLIPRIPVQLIKDRLLPAILALSSDNSKEVKVKAVLALPRLIEFAHTDAEVSTISSTRSKKTEFDNQILEKVRHQLSTVIEEKDPSVLLPLFRSLAQLIPNLQPRFRDEFILVELSNLVTDLVEMQNPSQGSSGSHGVAPTKAELDALVGVILDIYSAVSCCFLPSAALQNYFVPSLAALIPLLDPERSNIASSILRDSEKKLGLTPTQPNSSVGPDGGGEVATTLARKMRDINSLLKEQSGMFKKK